MIEQHRQYGRSPRHNSNDRDRCTALTPRSARTTRSSAMRARRHSSDDGEAEDEADRDRDNSGGEEEEDEDEFRDDMSLC